MNIEFVAFPDSIIDSITEVAKFQYDLVPLMEAIEEMADENPSIAEAIARSVKTRMEGVEEAFSVIVNHCRNQDMQRIEREKAAKELAETDEFTAAAIDAAELARRMALDIGKLCEFAVPTANSIHSRMAEMEKMGADARALAARFGAVSETRARNVSGDDSGAPQN